MIFMRIKCLLLHYIQHTPLRVSEAVFNVFRELNDVSYRKTTEISDVKNTAPQDCSGCIAA